MCVCVCACVYVCAWWAGACAGGVRFSNSNRIIPSDYRILLLLKMPIPSMYVYISGGPLSALTRCVNARLLSAIKKISPLIYSQSWVGSWVYTTQAMMTFTLIF